MRKSISVKEGGVNLTLNSNIYLKKAVLLACEAFGEGSFVNLDLVDGDYIVRLTPKEKGAEPEIIGYEFFNYVLGIMQNV
jgi:hypothetical protein